MKIEVRSSNVPISEPLEVHIRRRLGFALRRFGTRISHVVVRLVDQNGPKGGLDKRCTISAQLTSPAESVFAKAIHGDAYAAVDQAAARLDSRTARAIRRARPERRRPLVALRPVAATELD